MGFSCGIVGLPNAGKSTLFNALVSAEQAKVAGFAFCTIDPNLGRVEVPDERLARLAEVSGSQKSVPARLEVLDIAGLVRGASSGEGLGNRFLANIRETELVLHVLRCFEGEVNHVEGGIDPLRDAELVETELALADLESVERQEAAAVKRARGGDEEAAARLKAIALARGALDEGRPARSAEVPEDLRAAWRGLQLLTAKDGIYVANVGEDEAASGNALSAKVSERAEAEGLGFVCISAALEAEIAALDDEGERSAFLGDAGLAESGLARLLQEGYRRLGLATFFTSGPKETRAWTIPAGALAPEAAGRIHGDMERGFIRAETIAWEDFIACGGEAKARERGLLRSEGKDYAVQDGDVLHIRFNV